MHYFLIIVLSATLVTVVPYPTMASESKGPLSSSTTSSEIDGSVRVSDLDSLPQTAFSTRTPWHAEPVRFSGVLLKDYVTAKNIKARKLRFVALNDYVVESDVKIMVDAGAMLVTRMNGQTMPINAKGPVFILFDFDGNPSLQHSTYYTRSIWQLDKIEIVE